MAERVVAVLGYSGRKTSELHPICIARVARAQELAAHGQAVILSGWARRNCGTSEAELMLAAWRAPGAVLHSERTARSTAGNAATVAAAAGALGAEELVVVTSRWHRPRAWMLFRAALRGRHVRLRVEGAAGPRPPAVITRELVCLAFVPFQLWRVRRMARKDILQPGPGRKTTQTDRERREQALRSAERARQLAEKAQAVLDRRRRRQS